MESKIELYKALAAFQQEVPTIHEGTKGYGYTYANLNKILSIINPLLKKNGLGFTQVFEGHSINTTLFHIESGATIESVLEVPRDVVLKGMNHFQIIGSAITYYRRYSLSSILGLVTDVDADATGKELMTDAKFEKAKGFKLDHLNILLETYKFNKPQQRKELEEIRDKLKKQ